MTQRRALLEAMGVRVTLLPGMRGGPGFKPESVTVEFVDPDAGLTELVEEEPARGADSKIANTTMARLRG